MFLLVKALSALEWHVHLPRQGIYFDRRLTGLEAVSCPGWRPRWSTFLVPWSSASFLAWPPTLKIQMFKELLLTVDLNISTVLSLPILLKRMERCHSSNIVAVSDFELHFKAPRVIVHINCKIPLDFRKSFEFTNGNFSTIDVFDSKIRNVLIGF